MDVMTLLQLFFFMIASCVAAIASLRVYSLACAKRPDARDMSGTVRNEIVFLFEDDKLLDASDDAKNILQTTPDTLSDLGHLLALLASQFPDLQNALTELPEKRTVEVRSTDGKGLAKLRRNNGIQRLTVHGFVDNKSFVKVDRECFAATERELSILRSTAEISPFLVWREQSEGTVTWANNAYLELAAKYHDTDQLDP